jgi:hypothetical protein
VNVLFTLVLFAAAGAWAVMVIRRLAALRQQVSLAWNRLEPDQSNEAVRNVYNKHVTLYNDALDAFPANLVGPATGFKPAKRF